MGYKAELTSDMEIILYQGDGNWFGEDMWNCFLEVDLEENIDPYDYHDYPSTVQIYLTKEEVEKCIKELQVVLDKITQIENTKGESE